MCGKESDLFKTIIEGSELNVCKNCSRYGKVLRSVRHETYSPINKEHIRIVPANEKEERVVSDYNQIIKQKRERFNLTQEQLSKRLNEKESLIQRIESGHAKPSLKVARKLEKFLGIKLIEEFENKKLDLNKTKSGPMTIGDLIKIKKVSK